MSAFVPWPCEGCIFATRGCTRLAAAACRPITLASPAKGCPLIYGRNHPHSPGLLVRLRARTAETQRGEPRARSGR